MMNTVVGAGKFLRHSDPEVMPHLVNEPLNLLLELLAGKFSSVPGPSPGLVGF